MTQIQQNDTNQAEEQSSESTEHKLHGGWRDYEPTVKEKALSAASWVAGISWMSTMTPLMAAAQHLRGIEAAEGVSRLFCRGMVACTFAKWRTVSHPDIRDDETYLFAQNHINHFDFVTLYPGTKHIKQGVELETHFKYPVYGWYMKSRGTIGVPADRNERLPKIKKQITAAVDKGQSILAFPEGTRTHDGRVGEFKSGLFVVARDLGMKVVPSAVTGMYDVMRRSSYHIRPFQEVTLWHEKPVDFAGVSDEELPAKIEEVRSAIARRVDAYFAEKHGQ